MAPGAGLLEQESVAAQEMAAPNDVFPPTVSVPASPRRAIGQSLLRQTSTSILETGMGAPFCVTGSAPYTPSLVQSGRTRHSSTGPHALQGASMFSPPAPAPQGTMAPLYEMAGGGAAGVTPMHVPLGLLHPLSVDNINRMQGALQSLVGKHILSAKMFTRETVRLV